VQVLWITLPFSRHHSRCTSFKFQCAKEKRVGLCPSVPTAVSVQWVDHFGRAKEKSNNDTAKFNQKQAAHEYDISESAKDIQEDKKVGGRQTTFENCIASAKARVSAYAVGVATEIGCSVDMRDEEMV
jgi:hypothetical protein